MILGAERPRALVVDDYDGAREAVCLMMDELGYDAEGVASGAEALARLAQGSYAAVVSDIVMPGTSGWEVAAHTLQHCPDTGVVLMTGQYQPDVAQRARELGVLVLEKPFSLAELRAASKEAGCRHSR